MKKKFLMPILVLGVASLCACGNSNDNKDVTPVTPVEPDDPDDDPVTPDPSEETEVKFEDKYKTLVGNLSLTTNYSMKSTDEEMFYDGVAKSIFNDDAYYVSNPGDFFTYELLGYKGKLGDYEIVVSKSIDKDNVVQDIPWVTDEGKYYLFSMFENPFKIEQTSLFKEDETDKGTYSLDLTSSTNKKLVNSIVFLSTGYLADDFEYFTLKTDDSRVIEFSYKTKAFNDDYLGESILTATVSVDEVAEIVPLVTPYPTSEYTETLKVALNNFESKEITSHVVKTPKIESDYNAMDVIVSWSKEKNLVYEENLEYPYSSYEPGTALECGKIVKDGYVRKLIYLDGNYSYNPYCYIYSSDDFDVVEKLTEINDFPSRSIAVEAISYDAENDEYYLTGSNALSFFADYNWTYYSMDYYNLENTTKVSFKLNEAKDNIASMHVESTYFSYDVTYSDFDLPFEYNELSIYDCSTQFNGTFEYNDEEETSAYLGSYNLLVVIDNKSASELSLVINGVTYEVSFYDDQMHFTYNNEDYYFAIGYEGIDLYKTRAEGEAWDSWLTSLSIKAIE